MTRAAAAIVAHALLIAALVFAVAVPLDLGVTQVGAWLELAR